MSDTAKLVFDGREYELPMVEGSEGERAVDSSQRADRAAVIVGGQVVTVHRIRVPIEGGKLQVSC